MRRIINLFAIALTPAIALPASAAAQSTTDLVGTWLPVSAVVTQADGRRIDTFGTNLKGILVFQNDGHFAFILNRADLSKFATNNRNTGTTEENKAVVQGSLAYFGTYTVANKTVIMHVDGGTWPSWYGNNLERLIVSFSDSELMWTDPTPSIGGKVENVWRRAN